MFKYFGNSITLSIIFLLLTRWLFSYDVRKVISYSNFTINLYYYIPLSKNKMYDSLFSETYVGLTDSFMKDVGIYSNKLNFNVKIHFKSHLCLILKLNLFNSKLTLLGYLIFSNSKSDVSLISFR